MRFAHIYLTSPFEQTATPQPKQSWNNKKMTIKRLEGSYTFFLVLVFMLTSIKWLFL